MTYNSGTVSREDYLEAILLTVREKGVCRAVDVARRLGYSKPSVTIAIKKLIADGTVERSGSLLSLTSSGLSVAEKTLERHTVLKNVLLMLGVSEATAEKDACAVEHLISEETFDKIRSVRP